MVSLRWIAVACAALLVPAGAWVAHSMASPPVCATTPLNDTAALDLASANLPLLGYSTAAIERAEVFGLFKDDEQSWPTYQFDLLVPRDGYVWHFFGDGNGCGVSLSNDGYYTLDGQTYYKDPGVGPIPLRPIGKT
jgi:hypothetical protein